MSNQTFGSLALAGFDDIFSAQISPETQKDIANRINKEVGENSENSELIVEIPLNELNKPDPHPFLVQDDDAMKRLAESVKREGVREPGIARKSSDGNGYELLCGNRRKRACELAGIDKMPVIIRELTNEQSVILMVDSNLQSRERILPSEKAWAYRSKMEALNHNGVKGENHSFETMIAQTGESKNQIFSTIRLTQLIEVLLDKVDKKQLSFNPAVELSYLSFEEQRIVAECMEKNEIKPSLAQAIRLKKIKQSETLTEEIIDNILSEEKGQSAKANEDSGIREFKRFFPDDYAVTQMNEVITRLLTEWKERSLV